ncbi:(2R)-3-sulfolactate dehydrogenase (NADP(+))-like [Anticarsia gemmatalis]|uniref:(2R)-3-sulfolactate dehydrogenase (NADP(+))-like n=1 Tax=Anticarsia gemmatalis TaxID=129554 RepID=UPI003F757F67
MPEVRLEEVRRFMVDSLKAVGAPDKEARAQADLLMHADTVGHYSHGLNRLEFYINDCQQGACKPAAKPVVLKESAGTAWVDGCFALGATVGNFCMELAIRKAKETGIAWVAAKGCNHYGMAGYWALKAEREGLIGISGTNSSPIMVPTRSKERALGTNPIAMAAPAGNGDKIVVDMASTTVAMGKIEMQIHKEEPLPNGWALGPDGRPTTDAKVAFGAGKLTPLGGEEKSSGYKGYCLATMMETFCSGLSGANPSHKVNLWDLARSNESMNLGQCFAAIDPDCFAPGFGERMAECLKTWRNLEPVDPSLPVLAPGDKEHQTSVSTLAKGTVTYPQKQLEAMEKMAKRIGVKPIQTV